MVPVAQAPDVLQTIFVCTRFNTLNPVDVKHRLATPAAGELCSGDRVKLSDDYHEEADAMCVMR